MRFSPCHLICEGRAFAFFKNHVDNFGYVKYNRLFSLKFTDSLNFLELNSLQSNWPAGQFIFLVTMGKSYFPSIVLVLFRDSVKITKNFQ